MKMFIFQKKKKTQIILCNLSDLSKIKKKLKISNLIEPQIVDTKEPIILQCEKTEFLPSKKIKL